MPCLYLYALKHFHTLNTSRGSDLSLLWDRLTILKPLRPTNCPNCKTSIMLCDKSKSWRLLNGSRDGFERFLMLLWDRDKIWTTLSKLKSSSFTSPLISLWLRSNDRNAGAKKSKKFFGTAVKELWLASKTLMNGGRLDRPPVVDGGLSRAISLYEMFSKRVASSGVAVLLVQLWNASIDSSLYVYVNTWHYFCFYFSIIFYFHNTGSSYLILSDYLSRLFCSSNLCTFDNPENACASMLVIKFSLSTKVVRLGSSLNA